MQLSSGDNERVREVLQAFPEFRFELYTAGKDSFISCLVCWITSAALLERDWSGIQNILALNFKTERKTARWNIYIAFFCVDKVSDKLKYAIQNDKFSARKILFDGQQQSGSYAADIETALKLLNDELFSVDIVVDDTPKAKSTPYNSSFSRKLSKHSVDNKEERLITIQALMAEFKTDET